jgi:hypothetical protein
MQNSTEMRKQTIYTGSGPNERVIVLRMIDPVWRDAFALDCMIELMYKGCRLPLFI